MVDFRINVIIDSRNAATGANVIEKRLASLQRRAGSLNAAFGRLGGVLAGLFAFKAIQEQLDGYTALQNRLAAVTKEGEDLAKVQKDLLQVSNRSRASLQEVVRIYSRLSTGAKTLGVSQAELIDFTETLSKTIAISGATSYEAAGALTQFSQAMASGALRGDELRSVLEQLPEVANVIGKRFGVTAPQLAILGKAGRITSDQIIAAFRDAREEIEQRFAKTVPTIAQSFTILKNQILVTFGQIDTALGVSRGFNKALVTIAKNLDFLVIQLKLAAQTFGTTLDPRVAEGFTRAIQVGFTILAGVFQGFVRAIESAVALFAELGDALGGLPLFEFREIVSAITQVVVSSGLITAALSSVLGVAKLLVGPFTLLKGAVGVLKGSFLVLVTTINGLQKGMFLFGVATRGAIAIAKSLAAAWTNGVVPAISKARVQAGLFNNATKMAARGLLGIGVAAGSVYGSMQLINVAMDKQVDLIDRVLAGLTAGSLLVVSTITLVKGLGAAWGSIQLFLQTSLGGTLINLIKLFARIAAWPAAILLGFQELFSYVLGQTLTLGDTFQIVVLSLEKVFKWIVSNGKIAFKQLANAIVKILGEAFAGVARVFADVVGSVVGALSYVVTDEQYAKINKGLEGLEAFLAKVGNADTDGIVFSKANIAQDERNLDAALKSYDDKIQKFAADIGKRNTEQEFANFAADRARLLAEQEEAARQAAIAAARGQAELDLGQPGDIFGTRGGPPGGKPIDQPAQGITTQQADEYIKILGTLMQIEQVEKARLMFGDEVAAKLEAQLELEEKGVDLQGQLNAARAAGDKKLINEANQRIDLLNKQIEKTRELQKLADLTKQLEQKRQLREEEELLRKLLDERPDLYDEINKKLMENSIAQKEMINEFGAGVEAALKKAMQQAEDFNAFGQNAFLSFVNTSADALTEFVIEGKANFKDFALSFLRDITRMIAQALILKTIRAGLGAAGVDTTALFGGGKAAGGPVRSDRTYLVGEKGPEIFQPNTNGNIIPNNKIMVGGEPSAPPQVNLQVVNVDDPRKVPQAISSGSSDQAILNVLQRNREAVRRTLG